MIRVELCGQIAKRPPRPKRPARAHVGLLLATAAAIACGDGGPRPERVVLVTIETLRADRVGCYGDARAHTPELDGLAATGVRFETTIAPAPLTLPSHASLFTALEPPAHGVRDNGRFALAEDVPTLTARFREAGFATAAFVGAAVLDRRYGLARGFDVYDDATDQRRASELLGSFAERRGDRVVNAALTWLDTAPERFFLWVHLYDPHADYRPPPRFGRLVPGDPYAGEIAFADAQVGRLLSRIQLRWGEASALVAVTSDHGESLGEHRERTHSYTLYDATQRVPLILAGLGVPAGRLVDAPVRLVDVGPTLLALSGLPPLPDVEGRDLMPLARGEDTRARVAYVETVATQLAMGWSPLLGIRTASHKYIRAPRPELYDLRADPGELVNRAPLDPERVAEFEGLLEARLAAARAVAPMRELDAEERMRLESLGYLVSEVPREAGEIGVVGGLDPKDHVHEVGRISQASTWLALGRPERALDELEGLSAITTRVLYLRARAAGELGRLDLVEQTAEEMLRRDPDDSIALSTLAVALSGSGRADQARRTLERALARHPDDPQLVIAQARVAEAEGELETAAALYIRAEGMGEDSGEARHCLAVVRLRQGRVADADALVSGLPEVFIQHPSLGTRLGAAYLDAGRPERAAQLLARTARANPHVPRVKQLRAAALSAAGRHEEALAVTRRAYDLEPDEATAANDLAWALAIVGRDLDRALELAREAADALPEEAAALDTLATVHLVRGEHADALATAHRALPGAPAPIGRHLHYVEAEALAGLGRTQEARSALQVLAREGGGLERPWAERAEALEHRMVRAVAGGGS